MKYSTTALAVAFVATATALPTFSSPVSTSNLKSLFDLVPSDVSNVQQPPAAGTALPSPAGKLALITIGRGTQNYTCGADPNSAPTPVGAVATLYNMNFLAANTDADTLRVVTAAIQSLPADSADLAKLPLAGQHFFSDSTTAVFDISAAGFGSNSYKKNSATNAPDSAQNAVPWLYLKAVNGTDARVPENYRLQTQGGKAPDTCGELAGSDFVMDYAAEYWFYEPQAETVAY